MMFTINLRQPIAYSPIPDPQQPIPNNLLQFHHQIGGLIERGKLDTKRVLLN